MESGFILVVGVLGVWGMMVGVGSPQGALCGTRREWHTYLNDFDLTTAWKSIKASNRPRKV